MEINEVTSMIENYIFIIPDFSASSKPGAPTNYENQNTILKIDTSRNKKAATEIQANETDYHDSEREVLVLCS